jgi:hypothetical protein
VILQNCSSLNSSTMIFLLFWLLPAFSFFYELWGFFVLGFSIWDALTPVTPVLPYLLLLILWVVCQTLVLRQAF